jgi:MFS family permease
METRALAIAFFYAVGTGLGGIVGPLLFGHLIETGDRSTMAIGFYLGAGIMLIGALAELIFGVKAEKQPLEQIARPLTATSDQVEAESGPKRELPRRRRTGRFRPGPGTLVMARGYPLTAGDEVEAAVEVEALVAILAEQGEMSREELARKAGARQWGPGRFGYVLAQAVAGGRVVRSGRRVSLPSG